MVKVDADTLSTVPAAPPAAGPDRAFEEDVAVAEGVVPVAEGDVPQPATAPITASIRVATIQCFGVPSSGFAVNSLMITRGGLQKRDGFLKTL